MQLFAQLDHDPDSFILTGASSATSVQAARPLVVNYSNGSSDTIPAGTVAVLADGVTITFDRSLAIWVIYAVPGSSLLHAVLESQVAGLTGDYAPLIRILRHGWQWYLPMQPSGAAIRAGAWSGGAFIGVGRAIRGGGDYGIRNTQSIQGGGSVSGVPFHLSSKDDYRFTMLMGTFLKVSALPASDMTIWDVDASTTGYLRLKLTSAGRLVYEASFGFGTGSVTLNPTTAVSLGDWFWVSCRAGPIAGSNGPLYFHGLVYGPGGASDGDHAGSLNSGIAEYRVDTTARLGWGVSQSSSYLAFPNTAGNELSKLQGMHDGSGLFSGPYGPDWVWGPPTADASPSGLDYLYLCRDSVGAAATLTDSTGSYTLSAGSQGMTVIADGPYT